SHTFPDNDFRSWSTKIGSGPNVLSAFEMRDFSAGLYMRGSPGFGRTWSISTYCIASRRLSLSESSWRMEILSAFEKTRQFLRCLRSFGSKIHPIGNRLNEQGGAG